MKTVLYIKDADNYQNRRKMSGVSNYARAHSWNLQVVSCTLTESEVRKLVDLWHPSGMIVNFGVVTGAAHCYPFNNIPTIYFHDPDMPANCISCDSEAVAECAGKELLSLNLRSYVYLPWICEANWSRIRCNTFESILALHGKSALVAPICSDSGSSADVTQHIAKWLRTLELPVGLFAANDTMAEIAVSACRIAGLEVPADVAIVGVDDDCDLCEASSPTISSVAFDYYAAGELAARTLDKIMDNSSKRRVFVKYSPLGVVRRESIRRLECKDSTASAVIERIRREACQGLSAVEALSAFPCSRRSAEIRFRKAAGRSALAEIRAVRLAKAKELLSEGGHKLDYVANVCGFKSLAAFSAFFLKETEILPSKWRRK